MRELQEAVKYFTNHGKLPFTAGGLILFYNMINAKRGFAFTQHLEPVARALMDDRIPKLMVIIGPGAGKSLALSTVYPAFRLGCDPTMTIVGVSAGEALMQGFMTAVMEWVEHSPVWKMLFPNVKPDKDARWSTERGMFVTGRAPGDADASYFVSGLTSSKLPGVHARLMILDDLHNDENSANEAQCLAVRKTYYNTLLGRADPRGCRFIMAGRRWHQEDLYGHLSGQEDWVVMTLPAERPGSTELYWDVQIPSDLVCCFNDGSACS